MWLPDFTYRFRETESGVRPVDMRARFSTGILRPKDTEIVLWFHEPETGDTTR